MEPARAVAGLEIIDGEAGSRGSLEVCWPDARSARDNHVLAKYSPILNIFSQTQQ